MGTKFFELHPPPKTLFNAKGGIATRPTFGIFGEAGPEALMPLNKLSEMGSRSRGAVHFGDTQIIINGNASERTVDSFRAALEEHRRELWEQVHQAMNDYSRNRDLGD